MYRTAKGTVKTNPPRDLIKDVDSLPFPARDLVDMSRLGTHKYIDVGRVSATMISSRGCPFKCAFCSSHITMGKIYRFRSAQNVLAEIDELVGRYQVNHVAFEDDTFTLNRDRVETICRGLIQRNYDLTWYCLSRVESMDLELARLMRRAGCRLVSFGIESGNPDILQKIHKKISLPAARQAIEACYQAGLRSQCTFILGFPFDTQQTMADTLHFAQELSPTIAIFFALVPYPGTEMYQYLPESLRPHQAEQWQDFANMINNQGYLSLGTGGVRGRVDPNDRTVAPAFLSATPAVIPHVPDSPYLAGIHKLCLQRLGPGPKGYPGSLPCLRLPTLLQLFCGVDRFMKCLLIAPPFSNVYGNFKSMMKYGFLKPALWVCVICRPP